MADVLSAATTGVLAATSPLASSSKNEREFMISCCIWPSKEANACRFRECPDPEFDDAPNESSEYAIGLLPSDLNDSTLTLINSLYSIF